MNKFLLAILISSPMIALAVTTTTNTFNPEREGLPLSVGDIKVVPMATNGTLPNSVLIFQKQMKENGYYEVDEPEARALINMRNIKPLKAGSNKPEDSNLKTTIADVGLAFEFNGVPVEQKNVIGYAAAISYKKGWTGVTEIFIDHDLGTCQYTLNNIKLSQGAAWISQEVATNDINGKITTLDVRGSINSGYIYSVNWADNKAMSDLKCASMIFAKSNTEKLISLAKKIDKFVIIN